MNYRSEIKYIKPHQITIYAHEIDKSTFDNLELVDDKIVLLSTHLEGSYCSEVIDTLAFSKIIGSWSAITSKHATVELQIRVMVDGKWSKYLSYQPWGFGNKNSSLDSTDDIAKISIDEILILDHKLAQKFQYKIIMKRLNHLTPSPKLSLVSFALRIPKYSYKPNIDDLPKFMDYKVPMLSQQTVQKIGSSLCSPTSIAMLLLYKGHDLYKDDDQPHKYIAKHVKDYEANIYGNWVFNTVGISSYGEHAYVSMMYSIEELMRHLVEIGPVVASVSGDMGLYQTKGHLMIIRGYRINDDNEMFIIANDPNINERFNNGLFVYYEYPIDTFINVWKGIVYVIES